MKRIAPEVSNNLLTLIKFNVLERSWSVTFRRSESEMKTFRGQSLLLCLYLCQLLCFLVFASNVLVLCFHMLNFIWE